ncbi:hypothetical protein [Micromonospora endophytica]|uniref:hypothetical protein n=1 Tax=Micromonospora endophytica TaxID=515350 RepID=UPI0015E8C887|nr:hypothetical protein [Micromonospora endophytica]BCJ58410.1 hypothetical protein Jiend_18320 [Micromonospora endophytica]
MLLGVCPLSQRVLTEQVTHAVRRYDLGAVARLPGSFLTFVRAPYGTYAAGDVTGVQRLHLSPTGTADSRPGRSTTALPEATGVHLHDDGAIRFEPYWSPPSPSMPATFTGPLLGTRLRMAVAARADLIGAPKAAVGDAVAALLREHPATLSGPRGQLVLPSAGFAALFRAVPASSAHLPGRACAAPVPRPGTGPVPRTPPSACVCRCWTRTWWRPPSPPVNATSAADDCGTRSTARSDHDESAHNVMNRSRVRVVL